MQDLEFESIINFLKYRLALTLPGMEAQKVMAPTINGFPARNFTPPLNARNSAVLVLLCKNQNNETSVLLTLRSKNISHSGQISFPGGAVEGDETIEQAALREAKEEVNLDGEKVQAIGLLSKLYVPPSNSMINPVVAYCQNIPELLAERSEVQEYFFVEITKFFDKQNFVTEMWNDKGLPMLVPYWKVHHSTPLWGATAMILKELLVLLEEMPKKSQ